MLKPICAIDDLENIGNRTLVLEDDSVNPRPLTIIRYPEDRGSLIYESTLYDWYGRKVSLGPNVVRIIRPFGYNCDTKSNLINHCDSFIVELKDGQLGIADLNYCQPESSDPNYGGTKLRITGRTINALPCLRLESDYYIFNKIDDNLIKETCLKELQKNIDFPLSAIGHMTNNRCVFLSNRTRTTGNQFFHHIVPSKSALIDFFTNHGQESKKTKHPPSIYATNIILEGFVITENGDKITASFKYPSYDIRLTTSIDKDCLAFCYDGHLYWYES